jgi:hypothetical protein
MPLIPIGIHPDLGRDGEASYGEGLVGGRSTLANGDDLDGILDLGIIPGRTIS